MGMADGLAFEWAEEEKERAKAKAKQKAKDKDELMRFIREIAKGPDFGDNSEYARSNAQRRMGVFKQIERIIDKYI